MGRRSPVRESPSRSDGLEAWRSQSHSGSGCAEQPEASGLSTIDAHYLSLGFFLPAASFDTVFSRRSARVSGLFASTIHTTYSLRLVNESVSKCARALA